MFAAHALLAALRAGDLSGQGQLVELLGCSEADVQRLREQGVI
jgi:biotin operon repressor